jgi:vancomycin resistance protein YoaR
VPARSGIALEVPATRKALLAAALSPSPRVARVHVSTARPQLTTREAQAMNITAQVGGYETIYGGDPNRIHNVQLVAKLIDRTLIAPGATFSFNETTGARTPEKGFREAPVIINGELQTGLGGGVCQVSTTVFNAAYEAGVKITARTNHALYISHYPTGRDATVNYPDTDLRFINDTGHWLLLRTFVGSSSLYVGLYGTPTGRRVESETAALRVTGSVPVQIVRDPTALKGTRVVEEYGEPPRATSVRRRVYDPDGKLLYDDVWTSSYRGEKEVVRVGTKAPPPPPPPAKPKKKKPPEPEEPPPVTGPTLP